MTRLTDVGRYDESTTRHLRDRVRSLETLLHAILRRHHPNGCEVSEISLQSFGFDIPELLWTANPQRGSVIVASAARPKEPNT